MSSNFAEFKKKLDSKRDEFLKKMRTLDGSWTFDSEREGIPVYCKEVENLPNVIMGVGYIGKHSAKEFVDLIVTDSLESRKRWDPMCEVQQVLKRYEDNYEVLHVVFNSNSWTVSNRDFVFCRRAFDEGNGNYSIISTSVEYPLEEVSGVVRANLIIAGWYVENNADAQKGTRVTYVTQSDLNGWIPTSVVNYATKDQPVCIKRLKDVLDSSSSGHK